MAIETVTMRANEAPQDASEAPSPRAPLSIRSSGRYRPRMAYWMLLVSHSEVCPSRHAFEVPLYSDFDADYEIRRGSESDWREIELYFSPDDASPGDARDPGDDFATVFREPDPAAVRAEIAELVLELEGVEPASGARWVASYLQGAKTIYRFTPHHADHDEAMEALGTVMACIQRETAAITYAEGEGWSNQDVHQVTWEFDREEGHEGSLWVAVLEDDGRWTSFALELSDRAQCRAFREGRSPGAALLATTAGPGK